MSTEANPAMRPLEGWALGFAALAINLGVFADTLDLTIVNVAVPAIAGSLGSSQAEATWCITSYAVAAAVVQPLTGWLTQRYGEVRVFMVSTCLFTMASVLCGLAPNIELLVLCRLFQGLAGGPLIPLSQALMLNTFPAHQKSLAQGLWGMTALTAPVLGPIIGGWLTDSYSWRWSFFINVPVGLFTVTVLWVLMRKRDTPAVRLPVDWVGAALLTLGVGTMQFMFDHGHQKDWFDSWLILTLLLVSAFALTLFAVWERREPHPIVAFSLFRKSSYSVPVGVIAVGYGAVYGIVAIYPLWLQTVVGYTPTRAGLASASFGAAAIVSAVVVGVLGHRLPLRSTATFAMLLFALGAVWQALLPADATFWQLSAPRLLHGIATPMFFITLSDIMYTGVPASLQAAASSLSSFVRTIFLGLSTALSVTFWDHRADVHHVLLAEGLNPVRAAAGIERIAPFLPGTADGALEGPSMAMLDQLAWAQSLTLSFNDLCWVAGIVFVLLIPPIWLPRPPFGGSGGGGMH